MANWPKTALWGDKNVLNLDWFEQLCITLKLTEVYTLNEWTGWYVNYIPTNSFKNTVFGYVDTVSKYNKDKTGIKRD